LPETGNTKFPFTNKSKELVIFLSKGGNRCSKTAKRKGCQIDYLIQCKHGLYVCEMKFSKNPIGMEVIKEVDKKIQALSTPKYLSCRPILIHVGGVSEYVVAEDYFDQIIDWTELI